MNYRLLSRVFGTLLILLSMGMGVCYAYAAWESRNGVGNHGADALAASAIATAATGLVLYAAGFRAGREILRKEAVVVVGLGWFISAAFGMLPFVFATPGLSVPAAFFESVSGFTTTGSSAIADLDPYPRAILLWRALTQWLGGLGILVLFVALLSYLGVGGKSLFRVESSARVGEGTSSRIRQTAIMLWLIYLALTAVCLLGLWVLGMSFFDAVCHTLATVATGGFGNYNSSIAHFDSPAIDAFLTVMMLAAGVTFFFYAAVAKRNWTRARAEEEGRWFVGIATAAIVLILFNLTVENHAHDSFLESLRHAAFQVASILTTTGFATDDYARWPGFSIAVLLALMVIGGCSGSTAGGVKVARVLLFFKVARQEIIAAFRPRQVVPIRMNGAPAEESARGALFHLTLFGATIIFGTLAIAILEPDLSFDTCFSATLATLFNIGPGIGAVGPTQNFADFSAASYLVMSLLMVMGRLELFAVLVLFMPSLWRRY